MSTKHVYVLYGIAKRDSKEAVCMFFAKKKHLRDFRKSLPGTYRIMRLNGVSYDDFEVELP